MTTGVNYLPMGDPVELRFGTIESMPLHNGPLVNPSVTLGGRTFTFPVALDSGHYLEYQAGSECKVYDERGEYTGSVTPAGELPALEQGENAFTIQSASAPARAQVTVITTGEPLPLGDYLDSDGDGIADAVEGSDDPDGDTAPNYRDDGSDPGASAVALAAAGLVICAVACRLIARRRRIG